MRIGVFGGSFDPVHNEHIRFAETAVRELALDKLLIMPACAPPHKRGKSLSSNEDRLAMCRLAFSDMQKVEVSEYELRRGGTSYTYLTCQALKEQFPGAELFWLVGTDMLRDFPTWKNPEVILSLATLAVCGRSERGEWIEREQEAFYARFQKKFVYVSYQGKDVSSTKLRVLAGAGMRLTDFTPSSVAEYICRKGLYEIPRADEALALETESRRTHALRVAELAAARAYGLGICERRAIAAALFHDCAKSLDASSPYLRGFRLPDEWGEVPPAVAHQFAGAYVAERCFGVTDEEILSAVRYHTSGRANMSDLEKLIFLADMLESERKFEGVEELRALFWTDLDECMKRALAQTLQFLESKGGEVYPLTKIAYEYYAQEEFYGRNHE